MRKAEYPFMKQLEYILTEADAVDLVRMVNALCAKHRDEYTLTDIYLYDNKGKIILTEKQKRAA